MLNSELDYSKCSVVVSSFDDRDDIWHPFFTLFFRYWPNCPFPVYLINNYKKYDDIRVKTISVGEDKGWATNMKTALKQIPTPYVLAMLDDLFLEKSTNTNYIKSLVNHAQNNSIGYIGLVPFLNLDEDYVDTFNLGRVSKSVDRISHRASLWNKKILSSLLVDGENVIQMEIEGSKRSRIIAAPFLSVKEPAMYYHVRSAVIRGKWMYDAVKLCQKEGIKIDPDRRPIDYEWKWKAVLDGLRKNLIARKLKTIPMLGKLISRIFRCLSFLKINKLFSNGK